MHSATIESLPRSQALDYSLRTDIKTNAQPFFHSAADGSRTVLALLVHGFSGSPYDLSDLGRYLGEHNINARGVLLAGHGGDYEHLAMTEHQDWWQSVYNELEKLRDQYDNIILIGYSFGSNLVLDIASKHPEKVKGIICMSTSVFIRKDRHVRFLAHFLSHFSDRAAKRRMAPEKRMVYEAGGRHITVPLKGLLSFFRFIDTVTKPNLHTVTSPLLLIHSRDDYASNPRSSEYIFDKIGSEDKELFIFNSFEHNPLNSSSRDVVFGKILSFFENHVAE